MGPGSLVACHESQPMTGPSRETDGRRRRSEDSRARIVQAMLDLVQEGELAPAAEQVAARANVGLRTVFRHFRDMESLYREMSGVIEGELAAIIAQPLKASDWRGRLQEIVQRRAAVYEKIAPFKRASDVHRHDSPFLAADHARLVQTAREILRQTLPPQLAADPEKLEALDLLLSFEAWSRLRREQDLSARKAAELIGQMVGRIVG
jgi:AcrR family transcriptional regulator